MRTGHFSERWRHPPISPVSPRWSVSSGALLARLETRRARLPSVIVALLLSGIVLNQPARGQPPPPAPGSSALAGVIRDGAGQPIPQATIHVVGRDLLAISDDSGRFHLGGIVPGVREFVVMRIGFGRRSQTVAFPPDSTVRVVVQLDRLTALDKVVIEAESVSARFARTGFHRRQRVGLGSFVTPQRVDSLSHVTTPSRLLRDARGVEVRCQAGGGCVLVSRWVSCLVLFVDGISYGETQLDQVLTTGVVYAIEAYDRPSAVPIEFQAKLPTKVGEFTSRAGCGAIVVWTRSRAK